uniref:ENDD1 protein n=1 Tax=Malurus cyaneus samueli TaxID=2593467 RepID=A0A8C5TZQ3_9PASS
MLWLLLLQVLASCLWLGHSEVVTSFESCPQFFYEETTPHEALTPQNAAWICQRYNNQYHFATLYDRNRRIPVYSAYIYEAACDEVTTPESWWFVEPQLITLFPKMKRESIILEQHLFTLEQIKESQAVVEDYSNLIGLVRGHLNPSGHHRSDDSKLATFTLTNIVPQDSSVNKGAWKKYEMATMAEKSKGCRTTYVITGAVPGNDYVAGGRVNKPSHIWSAACCVMGEEYMKAWAVIAENDKNEAQDLTLGELEERLTKFYGGQDITLFHDDCPRE